MSVDALFDLSAPETCPFPSNRFTVCDANHNTGLRVAMPKPLDCVAHQSDCEDLDVINELDGFNLQPRLSIPFDGPIKVASVTSGSVFLVSLGSTLGGYAVGQVVGIDQVVWDVLTTTLHVESDELLDQHTRYVLVVTKDVVDEKDGKKVKAAKAFLDFVDESNAASTGDPALDVYRASLRNALTRIDADKVVPRGQVVSASVFTTQSVTAVLEKIRDQIKAKTPAPADFLLGPGGSRTVFPWSAVDKWRLNNGAPLPIDYLNKVVPGAVGTIAFGKYSSPDYRVHPGEYIPPIGTLSGTPDPVGTSEITFALFLPSKDKPPDGYPVVINGTPQPHGGGVIAAKMAQQGIATIAISEPGTGSGPLNRYNLEFKTSSPVTFPIGNRGDGGVASPRLIQGARDERRQMVADLMQLVRVIQVGVDVDGDNAPGDPPDLDPSRIYYCGVSAGGNYGIIFMAIEPIVRAGVLCALGGGGDSRLSATYRDSMGDVLNSRTPSLINSPGVTSIEGITVGDNPNYGGPYYYSNENMPLRNGTKVHVDLEGVGVQVIESPVKNTVDGAMEIQQYIENGEWAWQAGDAVAYAPYIRRRPLNGVPEKLVIIQFAKGDRNVPNPTTTAILRAGNLADRATFVHTDLVFTANPILLPRMVYNYPHGFMGQGIKPGYPDKVRAIAYRAQHQIASFFASDGTLIIDPDTIDPIDLGQDPQCPLGVDIFEVPVAPAELPEALNYLKNQ